eukprot:5282498-Amphidinium_carterae.1
MLEKRLARIPYAALLGPFLVLQSAPRRGGSLVPMSTTPPGSFKAGPAPSAHHRAYRHSVQA